MAPALEALLRPPIGFAHRGGRAHTPENTLEAFRLGLRLGATGLESDVWLTADGVPVLDHDGRARVGRRTRPIATLNRYQLPAHIPSLSDLYAACGTEYQLSLDVKDPAAAPVVLAVAGQGGQEVPGRLWLCHPDWEQVAAWRGLSDMVRLVVTTRRRAMKQGPERSAAQLRAAGVDAVNLHHLEWTGGLTTLFHRFGRYALAWDAQHERVMVELARMGIDGVYSDHIDRMVEALGLA